MIKLMDRYKKILLEMYTVERGTRKAMLLKRVSVCFRERLINLWSINSTSVLRLITIIIGRGEG